MFDKWSTGGSNTLTNEKGILNCRLFPKAQFGNHCNMDIVGRPKRQSVQM